MSKFRIGDTVRIRDIEENHCSPTLANHIGKTFVVIGKDQRSMGEDYELLDIGHGFPLSWAKRFELVEESPKPLKPEYVSRVDWNAPIERQFTRDGRKVEFITGLPYGYFGVIVEGKKVTEIYSSVGRPINAGERNLFPTKSDIVTVPVKLPVEVVYLRTYRGGINGNIIHGTYKNLETIRGINSIALHKVTYDPNDESITYELVK